MQAAATRRNQTRKNVQEDISTACAAWMLAARTGQARYRDVSRAEARRFGPDAWGRVEFTNYNGPGNTLQRCLVLTREGILVIVDTFTAGPRCDGRAGGQLWQLYTLHERGANWFASQSDGVNTSADGSTAERRMLVKFMNSPGVTIDAKRVQPRPCTPRRPTAPAIANSSQRTPSEFYQPAERRCQPWPCYLRELATLSSFRVAKCQIRASAMNPWPSFATFRAPRHMPPSPQRSRPHVSSQPNRRRRPLGKSCGEE